MLYEPSLLSSPLVVVVVIFVVVAVVVQLLLSSVVPKSLEVIVSWVSPGIVECVSEIVGTLAKSAA